MPRRKAGRREIAPTQIATIGPSVHTTPGQRAPEVRPRAPMTPAVMYPTISQGGGSVTRSDSDSRAELCQQLVNHPLHADLERRSCKCLEIRATHTYGR